MTPDSIPDQTIVQTYDEIAAGGDPIPDAREAMRLTAAKLGVDMERVEAAVFNDLFGMIG